MATPEHIEVTLAGGGSIALIVDVDFFTTAIDDLMFVRELAAKMRGYDPLAEPAAAAPIEPPAATVKVTKPLRDIDPDQAIETRREADRDRQARARDKARTKPATKPAPRSRPAGGTDYTEIAADIAELRAAGKPIQSGLAAKHGVPVTTTANWIAKCRQLGLIPKEPASGIKVIEDNTGPDGTPQPFDAIRVAFAYRDAIRTNHRPVQTVADTFNIDRLTAISYVDRARQAGTLPPAGTPQLADDERHALLNTTKPDTAA